MGLFSFLKKAGAKIFDRKGDEPVKTVAVDVEEAPAAPDHSAILENQRLILLRGIVDSLGLKVDNMELDLNDDKVTVYGSIDTQSNKEKVILALGNVAGVATVDDRLRVENPEPEATFYTVRKGDSLSKIAKAQYGDAMKYPVIFEANKPMLSDPSKIYPGQTLRIPAL